ncbi:MAG: HEPN domain-containing protein [Halothiobacillaceae bacterium]
MPDPEEIAVASERVAKAESDLRAAATLLRTKDCPTDVVCFHAQQVVEKYIKVLPTALQVEFPKTHNIGVLMQLLGPRHRIELSESEQDILTDYATTARDPGFGDIPLSKARTSVALARRVRKHIRSILPREALRRKS